MSYFRNRRDAGRQLAAAIKKVIPNAVAASQVVVLGLPRGGVVTADEVARANHWLLDIVVPRKIGAPHDPELAIGAITEDGREIFNPEIINSYGISDEFIQAARAREKAEAQRRLQLYRAGRPVLDLQNKTAIIIDDGIATGATMEAAVTTARDHGAVHIMVAAPVGAPDTVERLAAEVDKIIILKQPQFFMAVGQFYEEFEQITDEEVIKLLARNAA